MLKWMNVIRCASSFGVIHHALLFDFDLGESAAEALL